MEQADISTAKKLLDAERYAEARAMLESLVQADPKSFKAQGLLAMTLLKMNALDEASALYEQLVYDNPADPTLRLNLGSAYLRLEKFDKAADQLQIVLDFEPDHKKAQSLLGAAFAKLGNYEEAQTLFIRCGNVRMAERMEQAIRKRNADAQGAPTVVAAPPPPKSSSWDQVIEVSAPVSGAPHKAAAAAPQPPAAAAVPKSTSGSGNAYLEGEGYRPNQPPAEQPAEKEKEEEPSEKFQKVVGNARFNSELFGLGASGGSANNKRKPSLIPLDDVATPFKIGTPVEILVEKKINTRISGLMISTGDITFTPIDINPSAASSQKNSTSGREQMLTLLGNGTLSISPMGRTFVAIQLRAELAYFQSSYVYAFESSLTYESSSLPIGNKKHMDFVYMKGTGNILLALPGPLFTKSISTDVCQLPRECLVGWKGRLLPQMPTFPENCQHIADELELVEIRGTGTVLFTVDAMKD